jgi:hypothetical protein
MKLIDILESFLLKGDRLAVDVAVGIVGRATIVTITDEEAEALAVLRERYNTLHADAGNA